MRPGVVTMPHWLQLFSCPPLLLVMREMRRGVVCADAASWFARPPPRAADGASALPTVLYSVEEKNWRNLLITEKAGHAEQKGRSVHALEGLLLADRMPS
jgi:hypothetical protein